MDHLIIYKKKDIIYTTEKYKNHNKLLIKSIEALKHISKRFFNDNFIKLKIGNYNVAYFKTITKVNFILICEKNEKDYFKKIYEIYSKAKLYDDFKLIDPYVQELLK